MNDKFKNTDHNADTIPKHVQIDSFDQGSQGNQRP